MKATPNSNPIIVNIISSCTYLPPMKFTFPTFSTTNLIWFIHFAAWMTCRVEIHITDFHLLTVKVSSIYIYISEKLAREECTFWVYNVTIVRSNTRYVHLVVTPSAAPQLNHRLCPHRGIKGYGDHTIVCVWFLILESKGTGRCCYSVLLPQAPIKD